MKRIIYENKDGYKRISLIRDSDPDTMASQGIQCGPPDVRDLPWDEILREMNNLLVDRGFTDLSSLNIGGLDNSIITPIKRHLIAAYKNKENNNG